MEDKDKAAAGATQPAKAKAEKPEAKPAVTGTEKFLDEGTGDRVEVTLMSDGSCVEKRAGRSKVTGKPSDSVTNHKYVPPRLVRALANAKKKK